MTARACSGHGGRGCPCAFHELHRVTARRSHQKKRDAKLAVINLRAQRCQRRAGAGKCDWRLETEIVGYGRTAVVCGACERRKRGICRDCNAPVEGAIGKAMRCATHKEIARREQIRASEERHHERRLAGSRAYYQRNEDVRQRRNEYKRAWRKANREKVAEQKKRYVERHREDPNSAYNRYHARYRRKHGLYYRSLQAEKDAERRALRVVPPCVECGKKTGWQPRAGIGGRPWTTCMRCCWPHQRKARRRTLREHAKRIAADPRFGLAPDPAKVRKPAALAPRGPGRERLCLTPGCDIVVTHRRKKCSKCRRLAAAMAADKLAAHRGRGRRTDMERVA